VRASVKEILEKLKESTSKAAQHFMDKYRLHSGFLEDFYSIDNHLEPERHPPFEGAKDTCIQINKNGGSNFLFSHRSNYSMTKLLNYYKMLDLFSEIVSADGGFARKPDPQAIMYIIDKYGLREKELLQSVIERSILRPGNAPE
jgi:phosphoglycolate phosphatase-like HAD superfamily hydrolase